MGSFNWPSSTLPLTFKHTAIDVQCVSLLCVYQMEHFFAMTPNAGAGEMPRKQALETVKNNIEWVRLNKEEIRLWLVNNVPEWRNQRTWREEERREVRGGMIWHWLDLTLTLEEAKPMSELFFYLLFYHVNYVWRLLETCREVRDSALFFWG